MKMAMDEAVNGTVRTLRIAELVRDPALQVRAKVDAERVKHYASLLTTGTVLPPIEVAVVGGVSFVTDGWHRLAALESNGTREVEATVFEGVSRSDAVWMAAQANLRHGLPLKAKEKREVFRAFIEAKKHLKGYGKDGKREIKSYAEIVAELGTGNPVSTVRSWMMKDYPHIAKRMGGKEDFVGKGGLVDFDMDANSLALALKALDEAVAAAKGIQSARRFKQVLKALDEARRTIATNYQPRSEPTGPEADNDVDY